MLKLVNEYDKIGDCKSVVLRTFFYSVIHFYDWMNFGQVWNFPDLGRNSLAVLMAEAVDW